MKGVEAVPNEMYCCIYIPANAELTRGSCFVSLQFGIQLGQLVTIHLVLSKAGDKRPQLAL